MKILVFRPWPPASWGPRSLTISRRSSQKKKRFPGLGRSASVAGRAPTEGCDEIVIRTPADDRLRSRPTSCNCCDVGNHLVVSFRWHERGTSAREYLDAAEQVIDRMHDIDAELIGWSSTCFTFTCSPSSLAVTLSATLNLLREGLCFGVGFSQRDLEIGQLGGHFGPGLAVAEALATGTRAGEVLLDPAIDAVADEQLPTVGSLLIEVDGHQIRAALMVGSAPFGSVFPEAPETIPPTAQGDKTLVDMQSWAPEHDAAPMTVPASPPAADSAPQHALPSQSAPAAGDGAASHVPPTGGPAERVMVAVPRLPSDALELHLDDLVEAWPRERTDSGAPPIHRPGAMAPPPPSTQDTASRRVSEPPPKPLSYQTAAERLSTPPPKPNAISGETVIGGRESRIEALRDGELGEVLELVDQLWDAERRAAFVNHLDRLTEPTGNPMEESLQELHTALHETTHEDPEERGRLALAYAVCLAKAGKPAEALLESLQALATARRHQSANGERASELLLAQLARYTGQPQLAERWLKIPKAL